MPEATLGGRDRPRQNGGVPSDVDEATRALYALSPDDFMARRAELVDDARTNGDPAAAQAIAKLRKPTVGAWIVNALVLDDPSIVERLTHLGGLLRAAQEALDATKLRELSAQRRALVDELCAAAFGKAGRREPSAALRDEVSGTFDAAVADPDVAARLGRLQHAERWSGFGFLPSATPQLTVVRGGRAEQAAAAAKPAEPAEPTKPAKAKVRAADRRRLQRALSAAQGAFDGADAAFGEAQDAERELDQELRRLTKQLAKLQHRVDETRADLEQARKEVTAARARRRQARSALDRAEREAAD
jgi:hypothetical protein